MVKNVFHLLISAILTSHTPVNNGLRKTGMQLLDSLSFSGLFFLYFKYDRVHKCSVYVHTYNFTWFTE